MEVMIQILKDCEPIPCYRRFFVSATQWKYAYEHDTTPGSQGLYLNDDDSFDESDDEDLEAWYEEEWVHMPYVSGGVPASIMESEEEPLMIAGKSIFAVRVARMPVSLFDLEEEEEPLSVGGKSIFAVRVDGTPISFFDLGEEPLLIGGRSLFVEA